MPPTLSAEQIEAIVEGEHGDPFAVLGPHLVSVRGNTAVAIRAFLPDAERVTVVPADRSHEVKPMDRVHRSEERRVGKECRL